MLSYRWRPCWRRAICSRAKAPRFKRRPRKRRRAGPRRSAICNRRLHNAQSEQEKIQRQIANYQSVAQKEAQTLDEENYVFTNRAQDLIHRAVQELNADKKYKLILNATSLVDADSLLDITPLVLAKVNELYAADKKADKE